MSKAENVETPVAETSTREGRREAQRRALAEELREIRRERAERREARRLRKLGQYAPPVSPADAAPATLPHAEAPAVEESVPERAAHDGQDPLEALVEDPAPIEEMLTAPVVPRQMKERAERKPPTPVAPMVSAEEASAPAAPQTDALRDVADSDDELGQLLDSIPRDTPPVAQAEEPAAPKVSKAEAKEARRRAKEEAKAARKLAKAAPKPPPVPPPVDEAQAARAFTAETPAPVAAAADGEAPKRKGLLRRGEANEPVAPEPGPAAPTVEATETPTPRRRFGLFGRKSTTSPQDAPAQPVAAPEPVVDAPLPDPEPVAQAPAKRKPGGKKATARAKPATRGRRNG